jgi:1-acyl-sn-glycerol-3-phosphate acyltransferase
MSDLKPQNYRDERPAESFDRYHARVREHEPNWVYDVVRIITTPISLAVYRARQIGVDNVPVSGPVILASNHFSNMDHFLAGVWLPRRIRFLAKSQLFGNPVGDFIFSRGGVFPIRRGHADEEAFKTIRAIFEQDGVVMIYCEGGRSRTGDLGRPRPGVGRAALENDVPVVPVAIHGSQGIRRWKRLSFPKVTIRYGEPRSFPQVAESTRDQQLACAEEIFAEVRAMYEELEQEGRAKVAQRVREGGRPSYS